MRVACEPLSADAFAEFGDVIEPGAGETVTINEGTTVRYNDLARVDVAREGGRPLISIFDSRPFGFPLEVELLERHPLGSQAFVPWDRKPYLVVVAPAGETVAPESVRCFLAREFQGVNFHRGVWHHPVIVIEPMRFLVVDRGGEQENCDLFHFPAEGPRLVIELPEGHGAPSGGKSYES